MKKMLITGGMVLLALGAVVYGVITYRASAPAVSEVEVLKTASSPKNATYTINGIPVTLIDGRAEIPQPDSVSKVITEYFGNEVEYDFNQDGRTDTAFMLTQSTGGSGTFFYQVVALNLPDGYEGSAGIFVGDRIAPQSSRIINDNGMVGVIEVQYAVQKPDEGYASEPSVGKSMLLKFDPQSGELGEVVKQFEGEVDATTMKLTDKKWLWIRTNYTDGRVFAPKNAEAFSLTFGNDGNVSGTTDCNGVSGPYTAVADSLVFGAMATTMMYCDGSEEGVFNELLGQVSTYRFTSKGELELGLKAGTGTMILK